MNVGDMINRYKPRNLNIEYNVYARSREPNIPRKGYKCMIVPSSMLCYANKLEESYPIYILTLHV